MRRTTWTYITNIPPQHLEWNRRKHLICKEISRYNPSILCLQASSEEVDRFDDLDGLLKNRGFRGVHKLDTQLHDRREISGQSELDTKESSYRNTIMHLVHHKPMNRAKKNYSLQLVVKQLLMSNIN